MFGLWSNQLLLTEYSAIITFCDVRAVILVSGSESPPLCCGWQRKPAKDGEDWAG